MSEALKVDLYELTMAAAYLRAERNPTATFELFVRRLPKNRGYLVVAGLDQALRFISGFRFEPDDLEYLRRVPALAHLEDDFFEMLSSLRFGGDVWAMPEGSVAFANEPLLRVTAPLIEAQLLETYLLSTINFQTMIATKAARVAQAARGRPVADFGSRRAHGSEAGVLAARAAYVGGCGATSNLEAGRRFGIPVTGTMAHSFVMSFPSEQAAYRRYLECFGQNATLLVDTYDTVRGAELAAGLGEAVRAVRLDSGNLLRLGRRVRDVLDRAGRRDVKIFASGDLNESKIERLLDRGAPLDAFGVGTELVTSRDAPSLDGVYKVVQLVERDGRRSYPVKLSADKATWPASKQVFRRFSKRGLALADTLALADEEQPPGEPLLIRVIRRGHPAGKAESLQKIRRRALEQIDALPPRLKRLREPAAYPVRHTPALRKLARSSRAALARRA